MKTLRLRYLIRDERDLSFQAEWSRVWARTWREWSGEKKIVSGKTVILHLGEQVKWDQNIG